MSGAILILIGLLLCLTGAWSVRLAVLAAGFGVSWLLADTFGASTGTALLIGASGPSRVPVEPGVLEADAVFVGGVVGAVVGAKLFVLLDGKDASALLAVIFIPAIAAPDDTACRLVFAGAGPAGQNPSGAAAWARLRGLMAATGHTMGCA